MAQPAKTPKVNPGGLVTVAFLKAQLDEGNDHLGIFMPLLLDTAAQLPTPTFTTIGVQDALAARHKLVMPEQTLSTLLKRATRRKFLQRDSGRYRLGPAFPRIPDVTEEKRRIEASQRLLADALRNHATRRRLNLQSSDAALELLFRFLEDEQVSLLLGAPTARASGPDPTLRERAVVAEFVQDVIKNDPGLKSVLNDILEGLVLYQAAFLPDLDTRYRKFNDLKVFFDSTLVRQALGYEGSAARTLLRETVDVLKAAGAECLVFDKSVHEIKRILSMYEDRMATDPGRKSLRPGPMTRHFLTRRYSPSDIREMAALIDGEIVAAGFQIRKTPRRDPRSTTSERALAARLADPTTRDEFEPRVLHDVDCVAAIVTLRGEHRSSAIEDAQAVFATSSPLVIRDTRAWWNEDERETGVEPIVHIRALANLAWLKRPKLSGDFKEHELVALCTAALRPTQQTWQRFLRHLDSLEKSQKLTSNEVTAILVSAMSDRVLRDVEYDDPADLDAVTLDDVVERVKETYGAKADARVQEVTEDYAAKLAESEARAQAESERASGAERTASEQARKRELAVERQARTIARRIALGTSWLLGGLVIAGALALICGHPFHSTWPGIAIALTVIVFILLELVGILRHVSEWRWEMETRLTKRFRTWLDGGAT